MISDVLMFLFYILVFFVFIVLPCYFFEKVIDRAVKQELRRTERRKRQQERRELRENIYQSEVAIALNKADVALRED